MNPSILIADHDRGLSEATRRCLVLRGFEAAIAADGLQCLDELRTIAPAVLVLDPEMLWGGGGGVLEWLIDEEPLKPPIIVVVERPHGCRLPDRLLPWIDFRIQRPTSLHDLLPFVHELEVIIRKAQEPIDEPATATSPTVISADGEKFT